MVKIYFHTNYPKDLTHAISLVHSLQFLKEYEIERRSIVDPINYDKSVVFLFDHSKKKVDLITEALYDSGYRIFAFKLSSAEKIDPFQLGLKLMELWSKVLSKIDTETIPFIYTYSYQAKNLKKVK